MTGLDEGSRYEFAVSAHTAAGEGPKTSWESKKPRGRSIPNKMQAPTVSVSNSVASYLTMWGVPASRY